MENNHTETAETTSNEEFHIGLKLNVTWVASHCGLHNPNNQSMEDWLATGYTLHTPEQMSAYADALETLDAYYGATATYLVHGQMISHQSIAASEENLNKLRDALTPTTVDLPHTYEMLVNVEKGDLKKMSAPVPAYQINPEAE